jgi:hypothetical protein
MNRSARISATTVARRLDPDEQLSARRHREEEPDATLDAHVDAVGAIALDEQEIARRVDPSLTEISDRIPNACVLHVVHCPSRSHTGSGRRAGV